MAKIIANEGYAIVTPVEEQRKTVGGILIHQGNTQQTTKGVIVDAKYSNLFKAGDTVIYKKTDGLEFFEDNVTYHALKIEHILATLPKEGFERDA